MTTEIKTTPAATANLTITVEIEASLSDTWETMIADITRWWRQEFLACENSLGMHLEPRAGGMLFEKVEGEGAGFVWGNLISFQPMKHLAYLAQIVPPWGGPAQSVVQIALEPGEKGGAERTILTLTDSLIGNLTDEMLSCTADGWRQLYGEGGLKTFVESKGSR